VEVSEDECSCTQVFEDGHHCCSVLFKPFLFCALPSLTCGMWTHTCSWLLSAVCRWETEIATNLRQEALYR
jgi:hypothetical protein